MEASSLISIQGEDSAQKGGLRPKVLLRSALRELPNVLFIGPRGVSAMSMW